MSKCRVLNGGTTSNGHLKGADATSAHQISKQFDTPPDKESVVFKYIQDFFSELSEVKIRPEDENPQEAH